MNFNFDDYNLVSPQTNRWDIAYKITVYLIVGLILAMILIPIAYTISASFKPQNEIFRNSVALIPNNPTFENWTFGVSEMSDGLVISTVASLGAALFALVVTIPGAYVFGRKDFPGKRVLFYGVVLTMLFPVIVLVVPVTRLWLDIGLYNTIPGLVVAWQILITPLLIWILRDYFSSLPENLEEAAQVYGATEFGAFVRVILPIATPALVAVGFLAFQNAWSEFLFAQLITDSSGPQPAIIHLWATLNASSGERILWGPMMSQSLIIALPPAFLYFATQRSLAKALGET
jgi:multiple sugar transport system permease protein